MCIRDSYWAGDQSGGHGWYYDNIFTVNDTLDGFYWTINPDDDDCDIDLHFNVYDRDSQQYIGYGTYHLDLEGPCVIPAALEVKPQGSGEFTSPDSGLVTAGENQMRWNLEHLHTGSDYRLEYYWSSTSQSTQWLNHEFTHDGSNIEWDLNASVWDLSLIHI